MLEKLEASSETGHIMFFTNNKAEIVNNIENFPNILAREKVDTKACWELLVMCTMGPVGALCKAGLQMPYQHQKRVDYFQVLMLQLARLSGR